MFLKSCACVNDMFKMAVVNKILLFSFFFKGIRLILKHLRNGHTLQIGKLRTFTLLCEDLSDGKVFS